MPDTEVADLPDWLKRSPTAKDRSQLADLERRARVNHHRWQTLQARLKAVQLELQECAADSKRVEAQREALTRQLDPSALRKHR